MTQKLDPPINRLHYCESCQCFAVLTVDWRNPDPLICCGKRHSFMFAHESGQWICRQHALSEPPYVPLNWSTWKVGEKH